MNYKSIKIFTCLFVMRFYNMNTEEKLLELNDKIDLLTSQLQAEYLTDYQVRTLLYQIDGLTIKRDLLQDKINRENKENTRKIENNANKNSSLHFIILFFIYLYVLYLISKN